jgi:Protein of unknown function (DUF3105)
VAASRSPLRRVGGVLLALVLALAAIAALIAFLVGRDSSTFDAAGGPGRAFPDQGAASLRAGAPRPRYNSDPPTSGPHARAPVRRDAVALSDDQRLGALAAGNVVLLYSDPGLERPLRRLAEEVAGPFDPALVRAGQAVVLERARRPRAAGVVAVAWRHLLEARSPSDPALREFVEFWLGRGRAGQQR